MKGLASRKKLVVSVTGRAEVRTTELIVIRRNVSFMAKKRRTNERK
jgi:hypothetical protein